MKWEVKYPLSRKVTSMTYEQARAVGDFQGNAGNASGRWPKSRKQSLLRVIDSGAMTAEEAREKFALSARELEAWRREFST